MSLLLTSWRSFQLVYVFMGLRLISLFVVLAGLIYIAGLPNKLK
jgi:hypothetical protein